MRLLPRGSRQEQAHWLETEALAQRDATVAYRLMMALRDRCSSEPEAIRAGLWCGRYLYSVGQPNQAADLLLKVCEESAHGEVAAVLRAEVAFWLVLCHQVLDSQTHAIEGLPGSVSGLSGLPCWEPAPSFPVVLDSSTQLGATEPVFWHILRDLVAAGGVSNGLGAKEDPDRALRRVLGVEGAARRCGFLNLWLARLVELGRAGNTDAAEIASQLLLREAAALAEAPEGWYSGSEAAEGAAAGHVAAEAPGRGSGLSELRTSAAAGEAPEPGWAASASGPAAKTGPVVWSVQVGAFRKEERARELQGSLRAGGYPARIDGVEEGGTRWFKVRIGRFQSRAQTESLAVHISQELILPCQIVRLP